MLINKWFRCWDSIHSLQPKEKTITMAQKKEFFFVKKKKDNIEDIWIGKEDSTEHLIKWIDEIMFMHKLFM